ncbi:tonsoku-like protein isoform X2 [Anolis carolinensis]|uniref:tonsoku-like protein isoform X2 n=1 Tax=Anolis carolinensis TaxID=28377 RepID=UPI002F2B643E
MGGAREREIRQLQKDKEKAQRKGDLKEEAALCNQLGSILARHGQFQEALEEHRLELRLLEGLGDVIGCAVAHRKIGECLAELESYEAALKHQRRHLDLARSVSSDIEQQRAWATIGRTYMFMAEGQQSSSALEEAEKAFMKSLAIVEEKLEGEVSQREVSEMRARLYLNLGLVYDGLKDPAKHTYYIKKSIYISEQTQLLEDLYRAYYNMGNIHLREGQHSKAMRCLERARECACKMKEKHMESECCAGIAQVLLSLGDFVAAKRSLKKAYRMGSQQPQQRESVCHNLRYVSKVTRLQQALEEAEASCDRGAALALSEQLGDLFSKAGDYQRSLEAYKKQLGYAQALKRPPHELAVIHVSLAATFGDLKDHAQALHHYQEELALRKGNLLEEGKTWLSIALAKEEAKESYEELEPCFRKALQYAEKAFDPRLQHQILQHLHACQQRAGRPEAAETMGRLQDLRRMEGWHSDGEISEEEEEEEESSEPLVESDLELSDSDGEEEEDLEGYNKTVSGQRRTKKWNQRNDKGETLLHRACIDGNLRRVQFFVEKGHPLNPRDYCGWTPLHEACNHGHLEVVRLLLDHGAAVDDAGGPGCEGITPLHDALNCGHFDVAEMLVQRGASTLLRDGKGQTPLDTLHQWMHLYGRDLDQETRERCKAMEGLLKKAMAGRASKTQVQRETPSSQLFDAEFSESQGSGPQGSARTTPSPRRSQVDPELDEDCMVPLRPVKKRQRLLSQSLAREEGGPITTAPSEYAAAMRGVGSALSRGPPSSDRPARPSPAPALIPTEEYIDDDWLDDDLGVNTVSRKRGRQSPLGSACEESQEDEEEEEGESDAGPPCAAPKVPTKRRRARQMRLTLMVGRTPLGRVRGANAVGGTEATASASHRAGGSGQVESRPSEGESLPPAFVPAPAPPPPIRVRVRVQDNVFLIPVPHSDREGCLVSWLAEQASQRYYQACGLLPLLTLKKEGALLAPQDRIVDVLQSNEEVLAEVQSWNLPPLVERYRKACRSLAAEEHRLLLRMLERQESGPSFSVAGVSLRGPRLTPLLRALKLQASIRQLCLSGTGLGDDSAEELLASISTMPALRQLDLSSNRLGPEGLRKLTAGSSGNTVFQTLEELDLGLNPLGENSGPSLAALVQAAPLLKALRLQACGLTSASLQHHQPLKGALQLRSLALSHNGLGPEGLDLVLRSLPCQRLSRLDLGSVGRRAAEQKPLWKPLAAYLAQEGCALSHLTFSGNQLNDNAVAELARCLPCCPSLVSLDLSANPDIGLVGLRTLLLALEERQAGLQLLNLAGCSVKGPVDSASWTKLSSSVRHLQLCSRHLSRSDLREGPELWPRTEGSAFACVARHNKLFYQCL